MDLPGRCRAAAYHRPVMPYEAHPVFEAPQSEDAAIWRYMSLAKLISLLSLRSLFFSRADLIGDPLEGSVGGGNVRMRPEWYGEHYEMVERNRAQFSQGLPQCTGLNCWHVSEYESAALWRLYGGDSGVAVRSTYARLVGSLRGDSKVFVGLVQYADYEHDVIPEGTTLGPFLYKRRSFEHERELRAVVQEFTQVGEGKIAAVSRWERGLCVPVDTDLLIAGISVAPGSPTWYLEAVKAVVDKFGPHVGVTRSDLDQQPIY